MEKTYITYIAGVVVIAAVFYGGMKYGQSQNTGKISAASIQSLSAGEQRQIMDQLRSSFGSARGRANNNGGPTGEFVSGEIIAKDNQNITIKMRDGSSKIVLFSGSTPITKSVSGTAADLQIGVQLMINATANSDGSMTAQTIQMRPKFSGGQYQ